MSLIRLKIGDNGRKLNGRGAGPVVVLSFKLTMLDISDN